MTTPPGCGPLVSRRRLRILLVLHGHEKPVTALAFSPDGRWLATGSKDQTVRLWDLRAADPSANRIVLNGQHADVYALAFSPDGRWLAAGSLDAKARLWHIARLRPGHKPRRSARPYGCSPDAGF